MKANTFSHFLGMVVAILTLVGGSGSQSINSSSKGSSPDVQLSHKAKCGPTIKGVQFCTYMSEIQASPNRNTVFHGFLRNESKLPVTVPNFGPPYLLKLSDNHGTAVRSKSEILHDKILHGTASESDLAGALRAGSVRGPMETILQPGEKKDVTIELNSYYALDRPGTYTLRIVHGLGPALSSVPNKGKTESNNLPYIDIYIIVS